MSAYRDAPAPRTLFVRAQSLGFVAMTLLGAVGARDRAIQLSIAASPLDRSIEATARRVADFLDAPYKPRA